MKVKVGIFIIVSIFLSFFSSTVSYSNNISSLLGEYAQKADLSQKTKQEASGHLIIFTRTDLDKMKIKSLTELINYIPFIRYSENGTNLSDITYVPYQYGTFNPIVVYLNNKEITSPFFGGGFQIISKMDMDFIDHIEVYLVVPSYNIGLHSALYVIKLYTKRGYRENSTVLGSYFGSYGTNSQYIYNGKGNEDFSYLLYINHKQLKRKKIYHKVKKTTYDLSRNSYNYDIYGEIEKNNIRIQGLASFINLDNFIGRSWDITTKKANSKFNYLSGLLEYASDDKSLKAAIDYSYFLTKSTQLSDGPLGFLPIPPKYPTYNNFDLKLKEKLLNANIKKNFNSKYNSLLFGIMGRYKKFNFDKYKTNMPGMGYITLQIPGYNREYIYNLYLENQYMPNPKSIFMISLKYEKHIPNGGIRGYSLFGAKLGYIHNNNNLTFKTFLAYKNNPISSYVLFKQKALGYKRVAKSTTIAASSEVEYRKNSSMYSVLLIQACTKNYIYFIGNYNNFDKIFMVSGISLKYKYYFDVFNKIEINGWYVRAHNAPSPSTVLLSKNAKLGKMNVNLFGGYISIFNRIGKFDFFNNLSYKGLYNDNRPAFNLSSTITYNPTNNLSIYLKGINLFNRSVTTDYIAINPLTNQISTLKNIQSIDRSIWFGVEYTF